MTAAGRETREARFLSWVAATFSAELARGARDVAAVGGFRLGVRYVVEHSRAEDRDAFEAYLYAEFLTADEIYRERRATADALLADLRRALAGHDARQARDPKNYGFPGDLASLLERLAEALESIGV